MTETDKTDLVTRLLNPVGMVTANVRLLNEEAANEIILLRAKLDEALDALRPFSEVANEKKLDELVADDSMTINVGLMNGNVTQSVIQWMLKVRDFRRARTTLTALEASDEQD